MARAPKVPPTYSEIWSTLTSIYVEYVAGAGLKGMSIYELDEDRSPIIQQLVKRTATRLKLKRAQVQEAVAAKYSDNRRALIRAADEITRAHSSSDPSRAAARAALSYLSNIPADEYDQPVSSIKYNSVFSKLDLDLMTHHDEARLAGFIISLDRHIQKHNERSNWEPIVELTNHTVIQLMDRHGELRAGEFGLIGQGLADLQRMGVTYVATQKIPEGVGADFANNAARVTTKQKRGDLSLPPHDFTGLQYSIEKQQHELAQMLGAARRDFRTLSSEFVAACKTPEDRQRWVKWAKTVVEKKQARLARLIIKYNQPRQG